MIYGPGDTSTAYGPARFIRSILKHKRVEIFGDGKEVRDYLFIRDLVDLTMALAFTADGIYNFTSGQASSFVELLDHLRAVSRCNFDVVSVPRNRPQTDQQVRPERLLAAMPKFRFTRLAEGLAETFQAFAAASAEP
jgi:UDP-glucose 4-epimerase